MKSLTAMLLAFGLALTVSSEVSAQQCVKKAKQPVKVASVKKTKTGCVCKLNKTKTQPAMLKTNTFAGYLPGIDTTVVVNRETGMIENLGQMIRESQVKERDPINNGGSLNSRLDGQGGLNPHTITNGMENTMSGSR